MTLMLFVIQPMWLSLTFRQDIVVSFCVICQHQCLFFLESCKIYELSRVEDLMYTVHLEPYLWQSSCIYPQVFCWITDISWCFAQWHCGPRRRSFAFEFKTVCRCFGEPF